MWGTRGRLFSCHLSFQAEVLVIGVWPTSFAKLPPPPAALQVMCRQGYQGEGTVLPVVFTHVYSGALWLKNTASS